jgi:hypothetical protein
VADIPLGVLNANNNEALIRSEVRTVDAKAVVSQTEPEDSGNLKSPLPNVVVEWLTL